LIVPWLHVGGQNGTATAQAAGVSAVAAPLGSRYRRLEPERTLLHTTVRAHWKTFLAEVEERGEGGASLPRFVVGEFERYLACGDGSLTPSGAFAADPRARVCAGALHRVRRRAAGGVVLQRARILPFVHHPPHARHCGSSRGSSDPAGAGASVGPLAAALGALSARPRPAAHHAHTRRRTARDLRPPAPARPTRRSARASRGRGHVRPALWRGAEPFPTACSCSCAASRRWFCRRAPTYTLTAGQGRRARCFSPRAVGPLHDPFTAPLFLCAWLRTGRNFRNPTDNLRAACSTRRTASRGRKRCKPVRRETRC